MAKRIKWYYESASTKLGKITGTDPELMVMADRHHVNYQGRKWNRWKIRIVPSAGGAEIASLDVDGDAWKSEAERLVATAEDVLGRIDHGGHFSKNNPGQAAADRLARGEHR